MKFGTKLISLFLLSFQAVTVLAQRTETTYFDADTIRVLRNPLNGWVMYLNRHWDNDFWVKTGYDSMPTSEGGIVRVSDYASTAYMRTSWAMLEPEEGKYVWKDENSRIYRLFKSVFDRGMRLSLRIVVDGRDQGQNTPMYVIDAGAEYYTEGKGNHKSPYPDDPVFQEKYAKFIKALAEDFNDPYKMDFIDAFGLGKWGESHAMVYKNPKNKMAVADWITSLYASTFTQVPLVIHYHRKLADPHKDSWGDVAAETESILNMAISKGYCLRHDAFGMTDYYTDWEREYARRWNYRLPILMEGGWITAAHHRYWRDSCGKYREGHSEDVRKGEYEASKEARVNMMDFRINDETKSWFTKTFDLVKRFVAEGGYRLYPSSIETPLKARRNMAATIRSTWENIGWGYCPTNIKQWGQRYKVAFALLDPETEKPLYIFPDLNSDLSKWIKGTPVAYETIIDLNGVAKGRYLWAAGLVDIRRNNCIGIEAAVDPSLLTEDKWLKINKVTIK